MNRIKQIYSDLLTAYGPQHWWPVQGDYEGETAAWEITVGAVLTQNTNWQNVERALAQLIAANKIRAKEILDLSNDGLAQLIRPAGYFNLKAKRLKAVAQWWHRKYAWALDEGTPANQLREDLLEVNGVGPETADSILLYAFHRPTFVIDAYTRRLVTRHGLMEESASYTDVKALFENALPRDEQLFNEYHALIVAAGKHHCKPTPLCEGCPLAGDLQMV